MRSIKMRDEWYGHTFKIPRICYVSVNDSQAKKDDFECKFFTQSLWDSRN